MTDLVFARYDGTPLDPGTVQRTFRKVLEDAGIPRIRFHDLRHSHASHLLQAGVHPKIVQERLGHSSIAVTIDTYSHLVPSLQEMAAQRIETIIGEEAMEELRTIGVEKSVGIVPVVEQPQHVGKMLVECW
jgi:integrase